jgi:pyruvate kinase
LLTSETAAGRYPVESVAVMARLVERTEASGRARRLAASAGELSVPQSVCLAGCRSAHEVGARTLAVFTQSGFSARQAARFRPSTPILAFAASSAVERQLNLVWGVTPRRVGRQRTIEGLVEALDRMLLRERLARRGELAVVLSGSPIGVSGTTNLMQVHRVGGHGRGRR